MKDPNMTPLVLEVFNAASATTAESKSAAMADVHIAAKAFAKDRNYKKVADKIKTGMIAKILKEKVRSLPKDISKHIVKRKLAQAIPLIGAGIGAGFNYWFLRSICESAYMLFRELHLKSKYGNFLE
jgi:hypothetical protein